LNKNFGSFTRSGQLTKIWGLDLFKYDIKQKYGDQFNKALFETISSKILLRIGIEQLLKSRII